MRQHKRFVPLFVRIASLFLVLTVIVCAAAGVFSYQVELERQYNAAISQNQILLNSIANSVATRASQIEIIIKELAYDDALTSFLRAQTLESQIIQMEFSLKKILSGASVYLSDMSPQILLLTTQEDVLTSRDFVVHDSALDGNEFYQDFKQSYRFDGWNYDEQPLTNDRQLSEAQAVYYYKTWNGLSNESAALIRCGVSMSSLFSALSDLSGNGTLCAVAADRVVYSPSDEVILLPADLQEGAYRDENRLYITSNIPDMQLKLVLALDANEICGDAAQNVAGTLITIVLLGIAMLILTWWILRRILARLQSMTQTARSIPEQGYDVRFPEGEADEVGQLSAAFNHLLEKINESYNRLIQEEKDKRHAMMLALQYQINPHYLFNSLYSLQLRAEEAGMPRDLCDSIAQLGHVLHYNLSSSQMALVSEEEKHMRAYVSFMQTAKKCEIGLEVDLSEEMRSWRILRFSLQPMLENAIQHGWTYGQTMHIRVQFSADYEADRFLISVENDGKPMTESQLESVRAKITNARNEVMRSGQRGVGMVNLMQRLELNYGKTAHLTVTSEQGSTRFLIQLPLNRCMHEEEVDE